MGSRYERTLARLANALVTPYRYSPTRRVTKEDAVRAHQNLPPWPHDSEPHRIVHIHEPAQNQPNTKRKGYGKCR